MTQKILTAAERYRQHIEGKQKAEIVDVTAPSGFVFKFYAPSSFQLLFDIGNLPQSTISEAVDKWKEKGALEVADAAEIAPQSTAENLKIALAARDKVLRLSYDPKLVVGPADEAKGEMSTDHISNEDLEYLFKWVMSGGNAGLVLATFPGGSAEGPVAGLNRQGRRAKAVKTRRAASGSR